MCLHFRKETSNPLAARDSSSQEDCAWWGVMDTFVLSSPGLRYVSLSLDMVQKYGESSVGKSSIRAHAGKNLSFR